ncbi:NADP-dependent oxidoreductase [Streptomyces mayteni]
MGEVVALGPGASGLAPGDMVQHGLGWREYAVLDAAAVQPLDPTVFDDPAAHLSQAATAWIAVTRGAEVRDGDTVLVTGAAGGVGALTGQFARLRGAGRVIGTTGSAAKGERLVAELGYDDVVLRGGEEPFEERLRAAAPDGIDVVLDLVGGEQLTAALALAGPRARVALLGAMSVQATGGMRSSVEVDTWSLLARGITLRGVPGYHHLDVVAEGLREFGDGLRAGRLAFPHVRLAGLDRAPAALRELLAGRHLGSVLVEV